MTTTHIWQNVGGKMADTKSDLEIVMDELLAARRYDAVRNILHTIHPTWRHREKYEAKLQQAKEGDLTK
jgi:hypothetical protein